MNRYFNEKAEEPTKNNNIDASFGSNSSFMMLSFYVKSKDVIKLYLYLNGQCMRFMPEDIKNVLPMLFNMEYGDNEEWLKKKDADNDAPVVDMYIEEMEKYLKDVEFDAFRQNFV